MNIWLHGGPKNAEYWGLELTTAGRELAKNIVSQASNCMNLNVLPFDYYEPDFSNFSDEKKPYSLHTIVLSKFQRSNKV